MHSIVFSNISDLLYLKLTLTDYLILGTANAFSSVFSDLVESFFKRCAGVKVQPLSLF